MLILLCHSGYEPIMILLHHLGIVADDDAAAVPSYRELMLQDLGTDTNANTTVPLRI